MTDTKEIENVIEKETVPQIISEEFFKAFCSRVQTTIRNLREKDETIELANEVNLIWRVTENLELNLRDEQAKVEDLQRNRIDADGRINEALKISQKDQDTIKILRSETVEAWKVCDSSQKRDIETSEKLGALRLKYDSALLELKRCNVHLDENDGSQLGKHKATLIEECSRLNNEVKELSNRLQIQRAYSEQTQKKLEESTAANQELYRQWDEATNDGMSNQKKAKKLEETLEQKNDELRSLEDSVNHYKNQSEARHARLAKRDLQLKSAREEVEKLRIDKNALTVQLAGFEKDYEKSKEDLKRQTIEMEQIKKFLKLKEDESRKILHENEHQLKKSEVLVRKISSLESVISKNESEIVNFKQDLFTARKEQDLLKKVSDDLLLERAALQKKIDRLNFEIDKRDGSSLLII